jgi:hypothetical protein
MTLIFEGHTKCGLCGKTLLPGELIIGLPALINTRHQLYSYFDQGFHQICFENWYKKDDILKLLTEEKQNFENSDYYKEMISKYGKPTNQV